MEFTEQQRKDADTSNDDKKFSVKSFVQEAQAEQHKTLAAQRAKYLHKSGFIQDPFHYNHEKDRNLEKILSHPPSIIGIEWPTDFIHYNEEE